MPEPLITRIPDSYETRAFAEVRTDADLGTFDGYASAFNFVDDHASAFVRGAFRKTLTDKGDRLPVIWFHDKYSLVGPVLETREDRRGVFHRSKAVDDGRMGSMVLSQLRAGNHLGMSFGFKTRKDRPATENDGLDLSTAPDGLALGDVRAITEVELFEYSVLPWTFASQPKAEITAVRSEWEPDALVSLLDAIKDGDLTEERVGLVEQIVAAWQARDGAGPSPQTPTPTADTARRRYDVELALALDKWAGILGAQA